MKIGFTYNLKSEYKSSQGEPKDANAEWDSEVTVNAAASAIAANGHEVKMIGGVGNLLSMKDDLDVDLVFNICEGSTVGRNRESQVPVILEVLGVPFAGSDGFTLALTLDKAATKKILIYEGVPTAKFFEASSVDDIKIDGMTFPMMVKPQFEGSSKGIDEGAKVGDIGALSARVDLINKNYRQPALVEEFISGTEYTVLVIGNDDPEVFAPIQVQIDGSVDLGDKFYTFGRIHSPSLGYVCPAKIPQEDTEKMKAYALKAYKAVGCRDFGRVDFRMDKKGNMYVLEVNPLPSLSLEDSFMMVAKHLGITYNDMVGKVINAALKRCGLDNPSEALKSNCRS